MGRTANYSSPSCRWTRRYSYIPGHKRQLTLLKSRYPNFGLHLLPEEITSESVDDSSFGDVLVDATGGRNNDTWGLPNEETQAISGDIDNDNPVLSGWLVPRLGGPYGRTDAQGAPKGIVTVTVAIEGGKTREYAMNNLRQVLESPFREVICPFEDTTANKWNVASKYGPTTSSFSFQKKKVPNVEFWVLSRHAVREGRFHIDLRT